MRVPKLLRRKNKNDDKSKHALVSFQTKLRFPDQAESLEEPASLTTSDADAKPIADEEPIAKEGDAP